MSTPATPDELAGTFGSGEVVELDVHGVALRCTCDSAEAAEVVRRSAGAFLVERPRSSGGSHTELLVGTAPATVAAAAALDPGPNAAPLVLAEYPSRGERGRVLRLAGWTVVATDVGVRYAVHGPSRRVVVVAPAGEELDIALVRLVRRVIDPLMQARGAERVHAAALLLDDASALAFAGSAGAGKTTLLLGLAEVLGAPLVAFDKLFLWPSGGVVRCAGVPGALGVGIGTVRHLGLFGEGFAPDGDGDPATLWCRTAPEDKARVPAAAVGKRFAPAPGSHPLRAVVFPHMAPEAALSVTTVPAAKGAGRLTAQRFGAALSPYERNWLDLAPVPAPPRPLADGAEPLEALLARGVRFAEVRFGTHHPDQIARHLGLRTTVAQG